MSYEKNFNAKYDLVILSKLDKDGNLSLLHSKPLTIELFHQIPDSMIIFTEGNLRKNKLDFEFYI